MPLPQPMVTIQIATKTDKVDTDGEPLYRCGSHLYRKSDLIEAFKKLPDMEIQHDEEAIWGFYPIPENQVEAVWQDNQLVSFSLKGEIK